MIRVDMLRKLVIIAIGGKIGNPLPHDLTPFDQLERNEQLPPRLVSVAAQSRTGRGPALEWV